MVADGCDVVFRSADSRYKYLDQLEGGAAGPLGPTGVGLPQQESGSVRRGPTHLTDDMLDRQLGAQPSLSPGGPNRSNYTPIGGHSAAGSHRPSAFGDFAGTDENILPM